MYVPGKKPEWDSDFGKLVVFNRDINLYLLKDPEVLFFGTYPIGMNIYTKIGM